MKVILGYVVAENMSAEMFMFSVQGLHFWELPES